MSQCHIVTLSHCRIVTLSHCHIVTLSHCHNVTMSHCHIVTMLLLQIRTMHALGPVATVGHIKVFLLRVIAPLVNFETVCQSQAIYVIEFVGFPATVRVATVSSIRLDNKINRALHLRKCIL